MTRFAFLLVFTVHAISTAASAAPSKRSSAPTTATTAWVDFGGAVIPGRLRLPAPPAKDILSRADAIRIALADNASLKAARERLEMARGEYRTRSAANNPQLSAGASLVPHPVEDENAPRTSIFDTDFTFLSYVFPTSGKRAHGTRAAAARLQAAEQELRSAELDLVLAVGQAYTDVQVAEESIAVQEDTYRIALAFTDLARRQFEADAVPETNVIRTHIEEVRAEQELRKAHAIRLQKEAALAFQLARPATARIGAADPLEPSTVAASLVELVASAQENRPETRTARATLAALAAEIDVARAARRPDLTVESAFTDRLTNSGSQPFRAFVQLPLWDRGQIGGEVAKARAEHRMAEHLVTQAQRQVELDVTRALRQLEGARASVDLLATGVLPRTRTLLDRARIAYLEGAGTLLDLLDAQRVYRQAALDYVSAVGEHEQAVAALERAIARGLKER